MSIEPLLDRLLLIADADCQLPIDRYLCQHLRACYGSKPRYLL